MSVFGHWRRAVAIVLIAWPMSCAHQGPVTSVPPASQVYQKEASPAPVSGLVRARDVEISSKGNAPASSAPTRVQRAQRISGATPHLPPELLTSDADYFETVKICVDITGSVSAITTISSSNAAANRAVIETVKDWKFKPAEADGKAIGFCYPARFVFHVGAPP